MSMAGPKRPSSERIITALAMTVVAGTVMLVAYVTHSNADAQSSGCSPQREHLDQSLDEVRFATSAVRSVSSALDFSNDSLGAYRIDVTALRNKVASSNRPFSQVSFELDQASQILQDQRAPVAHARAIVSDTRRELNSGMPLINEASADVQQGDCSALSLTMARSGWPKDHLLAQLAEAAHLNSEVSDKLEAALALITRARASAQPYLVFRK